MVVDFVSSAANPLLKEVRKAQEQGGVTAQGWLVAEGPRLVEEAIRSGLHIHCAIVREGMDGYTGPADRLVTVPDAVFRSIAATETPQGVLVLAEPPRHERTALFVGTPLIVILDGVQDPGNAGAIARSAEGFGATGIVFGAGSANPLAPKTLRASAGSLFRIPFLRDPQFDPELPCFAGVGRTAQAVWDCDLRQPCALVVGSEGGGISERFARLAQPVNIPTRGVESLNAAVAASVLLYEASRQRSHT